MEWSATSLTVASIVKFSVAIWLFSHTLPRREGFGIRAAGVSLALVAAGVAAVVLGYSIFPKLTDLMSFVNAVATFVAVLAVAVGAHQLMFDCPPITSLFCCSMAYSLENLSSSLERSLVSVLPYAQMPPTVFEGAGRALVITVVTFWLAHMLLMNRIEKDGLLQIDDPIIVLVAALAIIVNMVLDLVVKDLRVLDIPDHYNTILSIVYVLLCIYVMYSAFEVVYNRKLLANMATMNRMRAVEAKQYELSRENIEAINLKCHDMKHQIRALQNGGATVDPRVIDSLQREVDIYDSVVKTGNDALDTILTEKSLYCEKMGITLSCVADGPALDFMDPVDLYSFFGNALDNAIEAVSALDDKELRSIGLMVQRRGQMVSIHVENYFAGNVRFGSDGLPLSSKGDHYNHGFGTRSMRQVVESYDGTLSSVVQGNIFHLNALVPTAE